MRVKVHELVSHPAMLDVNVPGFSSPLNVVCALMVTCCVLDGAATADSTSGPIATAGTTRNAHAYSGARFRASGTWNPLPQSAHWLTQQHRTEEPPTQSRTSAELLIDCEENQILRAVLVGMLRERNRRVPGS